MRAVIVFVIMLLTIAATAQSVIQNRWMPSAYSSFARPIPVFDSLHKNWSFSKYAGVTAGYSFFKGGNSSFVAAPVGIQINRRLTNNFYAFTGVSVAPLYLNFNSPFALNDVSKTNPNNTFLKTNNLGMYSKAELGLMYINDAKTFSISGSIGVERSSTPVFYSNGNASRQNPVVFPNR